MKATEAASLRRRRDVCEYHNKVQKGEVIDGVLKGT